MKSKLPFIAALVLIGLAAGAAWWHGRSDLPAPQSGREIPQRERPPADNEPPYRGETQEEIAARYETLAFPTDAAERERMLKREFARIILQDENGHEALAEALAKAWWHDAVRAAKSWEDISQSLQSYEAAIPVFPFRPDPPDMLGERVPLTQLLKLNASGDLGTALAQWAQENGGSIPPALLDSLTKATVASGQAIRALGIYHGRVLAGQEDLPDSARWSSVQPVEVRKRAQNVYLDAALGRVWDRETNAGIETAGLKEAIAHGETVTEEPRAAAAVTGPDRFPRILTWYLGPDSADQLGNWEGGGIWGQMGHLACLHPDETISVVEAAPPGEKKDQMLAILTETMAGDYPDRAPQWVEQIQDERVKRYAGEVLKDDLEDWPRIRRDEEEETCAPADEPAASESR